MQSAARTKTAEWLQNRDGFSEYKNFERELISYCRVQIYCWTYYNMSMYKWKSGKFAYKTGFSFTKWESRLQNEIFIYKEGLLRYKRDSHSTFHRRDLSGCFLVHICVFYSSYSSYFAFLCTSPQIFRAKMEPKILLKIYVITMNSHIKNT